MGHNLTLLLVFNGGHTPLTVQWRRITNGVGEPIAEEERVILAGQHSVNLTITNLMLSDAGLYELNVTNQIDSRVFEYTVNVYGECMQLDKQSGYLCIKLCTCKCMHINFCFLIVLTKHLMPTVQV